MCRQTTCRTCQRPTWAGCGAHVEQVLGHIPKSERCQGHARNTSPKNSTTDAAKKPTFLQRFGRSPR
jgi:hypothetical protein